MSRQAVVLVVVLFVFLSVLGNAQLSSFVSSKQVDALTSKSTAILASSTSSAEATFFAQKILKALKVKPQSDCKAIASKIESSTNSFDLFYSLEVSQGFGCPKIRLNKDQESALVAQSNDGDLVTFVGALLALKASGSNSIDIADVAQRLKNLQAPSGKFKSNVADDANSATVSNAKIALLLLEHLAYSNASLKEQVADVAEAALNLLPAGDDDSVTDPTILSSLMKISEKKPRLSSTRLAVIAESLIGLIAGGDVNTASQAYRALEAVSSYKIAPIYISLDKQQLSVGTNSLTVSVKDALGRAVSPESTQIKSIKSGNKDVLSAPLNVAKSGSVDISDAALGVGRYAVEIVANIAGRSNAILSTRYITVAAPLEINEVFAGVTDSKQSSTSDLHALSSQNALADEFASALDSHVFHVAFTLSQPRGSKSAPLKPHQVFVRLVHSTSGTSTYLTAKALRQQQESSKLAYRSVLIPSDEIETFMYQSGDYQVSILVGDAALAAPIEWVVGTLNLKFPAKTTQEHPLYTKPLLNAADEALSPLPEIVHQMRPPAKRASLFVSLIFTGAVGLPLAAFVIYFLSLKPNLALLSSASSALFAGALGVVLFVYVAYWFQLPGFSFYQTLNYLTFLSPVTFVLARSSLSAVTEARKGGKEKKQ